MFRYESEELTKWLEEAHGLPLVVRGARQVGKTWLIRKLAVDAGRNLVEINFERDARASRWFESNDPRVICDELSIARGVEISPPDALLFLDEIQAAGELLAKLRWFAEELPELPVVAAGSLPEFALANHGFSMPVGRVGYFHVEPMTFPEYLLAHGQERLLARLRAWHPGGEVLSDAVHMRAGEWFHRFTMVGGMPAVVAADAGGEDARAVRTIQADLMRTYRDDFAKYSGRMESAVLDQVLLAAAGMLGRKFSAAKVGSGVKHHQTAAAVDRLCWARLCTEIIHTAANGLPLGGEAKPRLKRLILLDVGMVHALLGTPAARGFPGAHSLSPPARDQIIEQIMGQQLRALSTGDHEPSRLYFWQRQGGRVGRIDYLLQVGTRIIPVVVKAGSAGSMKSLHQFMYDKGLGLAVRCDANPPSVQEMDLKTTQGDPVRYRLLDLPHYLAFRVVSLVADMQETQAP